MRTVLYWAYGSNLDRAQMRRRCPDAAPLGRATLRGYRLAFAGASRRWDGGGVATLLPSRTGLVSGVLYQLSEASLADLDAFEGHPEVYVRCTVSVRDESNRRRVAHTYCMPPQPETLPSFRYLGKITLAYRRLGFDVNALEAALRGAA